MITRRTFFAKLLGGALAAAVAPSTLVAQAADALFAPILMYHNIRPTFGGRFNTQPSAFDEQMRWLAQNGFESVSVDHIARALLDTDLLPPKPVAITFDDGWRSQSTYGVPILGEYDLKATFYVVASHVVPGKTFTDWPGYASLVASGHALGSHSARHGNQTLLSGEALATDMAAAPNAIIKHLGYIPRTHAYPYGSSNAAVRAAARAAGFIAAVGVHGSALQAPSRLFDLSRIEVRGGLSLGAFANLLRINRS